jgi:hypothetical protein
MRNLILDLTRLFFGEFFNRKSSIANLIVSPEMGLAC